MTGLSRDDFAYERRGRVVGDDEYRASIKRRAREILSLGPPAGTRLRTGSPAATGSSTRPLSTESVLKVIAWTKGHHAAPRQAFYVGRARDKDDPRRQLALENERGELVQGKAAIEAEIASWGLLPDAQNRSAKWRKAAPEERAEMIQADALAKRQAVHLMLSVPRGAPSQAEALRDAVREAMRESFGDAGYRYLFAIHTDEPRRPHAHIIVKATSEPIAGGRSRQLRLGPRELEAVRARFTEQARERGFDVTCTRRVDRAQTRGQILEGKEPLRLNTRQGKLQQQMQTRQGSAFQAKAPSWYAQHGLAYERRRLQLWTSGLASPPSEAPQKPAGLFKRLASAFTGVLRGADTREPPKPPNQALSPALDRLDRHFAEVHRNPAAARDSFLAMYKEAPRLAVWAANNHPQAFGDTTGAIPTGRVTGRGLKAIVTGRPQPLTARDGREAALIAHTAMLARREGDLAQHQARTRREAAAVPKALLRVASRLTIQEQPSLEAAEIRKLADRVAMPGRAAIDRNEELESNQRVRAPRARDRRDDRGVDR